MNPPALSMLYFGRSLLSNALFKLCTSFGWNPRYTMEVRKTYARTSPIISGSKKTTVAHADASVGERTTTIWKIE